MFTLLTMAAVSGLALSAQDITTDTQLEVDAPVDLKAELSTETGSTDEIAKTDVMTIAKAEFEAADVNGDMTVTEDEYVTAALTAEKMASTDDSLDQELAGGEQEKIVSADEEMTAAAYLRARFAAISLGDGELTGVELESALSQEFAAADENGDDKLTGEEVQTFASIRRGETILQ